MSKNAKPPAAEDGEELGFLAHLIELRDRLLRMVMAIGIVFLILMPFAQDLYNLLSDPLVRQLPEGQKLIAVGVASPFFIPYKLALMVAFVLALPYVLYQVWGFVAPGLYQHEKKLVTPLLLSSVVLFYLGMAFAYFAVLPMIFSILPGFAPSNVAVTPDIAEYLDFVMMMFMAFGIGFEMPVATILLISTGIASREALEKSRPYVVVVAFIVGMLLTPPDVLSQVMLAVPMWLLFEVGLLASRLFDKQIQKAGAEKEARELAEYQREIRPPSDPAQASGAVAAGASAAGAAAATATVWEDEHYTYEETVATQSSDDEAFRPLTDEEMEAELERMDKEFKKMEENFRKGEEDKHNDE
ncbi:twin-arginine translocase subunit TatC [Thiothrix nivea]|uniref:Sec-independent protein translocase protein TatC n=1 Tax=Thiothrix nivea (strain ATCC 35100 / DSM 5205 / JP2) TaxID=870187 RepID=A0A656HFC6_THINJ|nr:twin-arginine translocase subunit TatC [Thiothrix nivea]EIJ34902.1 Sec-independent protein translocase TatC [Thiothrix nivea DSM 5205]